MSISGGIKFFYRNRGDIDNEIASQTITSGPATAPNARSRRRWLRWESVGSNDAITELYTLEFNEDKDIDRIIINRHNWKAFWIKYWDGVDWVHFSSVVTLEGTQATIEEAANAKTTSYYEFDKVTTDKIRISIDTTQTAGAEKYAYEIIATEEIGTLVGFPNYAGTFKRERASKKSLTGALAQSIKGDSFEAHLTFNQYPEAADHALIKTLWALDDNFLIFPCGANDAQFRFPDMVGNSIEDLFLVSVSSDLSPSYERNVYVLGLNYEIVLAEVP